MSWLGKIIGGGIGFALGGPIGAVIGAGLGHTFVDSDARGTAGGQALSAAETRQAVFFATAFAMLGKMAKADGRVSEKEIAVVEAFIRDRLGLDPRARAFAIQIFNDAKTNATPFDAYARQFGDLFADDRNMRLMLYELLFDLAMADGSLHPAEERLLKDALGYLRLPRDLLDELRGKTPDIEHLYSLLGVGPDVDDAELKRAWRKAVQDYHPDKIVSKGLPEEFTRFAEVKFKEVNEAYEKIVEHRAGG